MKKVKTQNGKKPTDNSYQGLIRKVRYLDKHITELTKSRNNLVDQIKVLYHKSDENIEFELNKLKGK